MHRNPSVRTPRRLGRLAAIAVGVAALVVPGVAVADASGDDRSVEPIDLRCDPVQTDAGPGAHCAWSAPEHEVDGYGLARRDDRDGRWQLVAHGGPEFREHLDAPLHPGRYEYVAVAFDEDREPVGVSRPAHVFVGKSAPERDGSGLLGLPLPVG